MFKFLITAGFIIVSIISAHAESTQITVRVLAKDAKFIGSSMDGVEIKITNSQTSAVLATGITEGKTGNTQTIMKTDWTRNRQLSDDSSASFSTKLEITSPVKVAISARGPLNLGDNASTVSAEYWLIPGKDLIKHDAILLEMPGFFVKSQLVEPPQLGKQVKITSEVRMMCGCPIEPEGLWDANNYEITAYLTKNGTKISEKKMKFEETSQFSAEFAIDGSGNYEIVIYAFDPSKANTGVDRISFKL